MDFGFDTSGNNTADVAVTTATAIIEDVTSIDGSDIKHDANGNPITSLPDTKDTTTVVDPSKIKGNDAQIADENNNKIDATNLVIGSTVEVGESSYTVDKDGNLIDKDGKLFKEAKEVSEWIKSFDSIEDTNDGLSINSIKDALGIEILDDTDKPIEFDNSPTGIASYVNAVIETSKEEIAEATINSFYQKYPIINDVINYYIANGNSLDGFGEIPDRSGVVIDNSNELQQENIIRIAWEEQGRKGDANAYIQYLKSSGTLFAVAKEELQGLQESDEQYRKQLEATAEKEETERIEKLQNYWNGVKEIIDNRNIAGYTIPDNIIINKGGQKLSVTPNDFFNYMYRIDDKGVSAYQRDIEKETSESRRDDEILRAYLKFVGGNYSNLVDLAVNKDKVTTLKLKAKERSENKVRITKPQNVAQQGAKIDFGYN